MAEAAPVRERRGAAMTEEQSAFLKMAVPAAQYSMRSYGVPASITIAQAILESGWGQSELAKDANNFFGIKAPAYVAPDQYDEFPTAEYVGGKMVIEKARFMKYLSAQACFGAHARLLALAPRYRAAMAAKTDPARFAQALYACGYSTNFRYAGLLMQLVEEFDLTQYDTLTPPTEPAAQAKPEEEAA